MSKDFRGSAIYGRGVEISIFSMWISEKGKNRNAISAVIDWEEWGCILDLVDLVGVVYNGMGVLEYYWKTFLIWLLPVSNECMAVIGRVIKEGFIGVSWSDYLYSNMLWIWLLHYFSGFHRDIKRDQYLIFRQTTDLIIRRGQYL
jgi:hypothetical protein